MPDLYTRGMKCLSGIAIFFLLQLSLAQSAKSPILQITGDVAQSMSLEQQEWKQLKHVSLSATDAHEKKTSTYSGI